MKKIVRKTVKLLIMFLVVKIKRRNDDNLIKGLSKIIKNTIASCMGYEM